MLLLDEVELHDGVASGSYTVRGDEFFLQGHFPGNPVVPGVILCEIMAQSACLLIDGGGEGFTPYFTGLDHVRFKNKVVPGDKVISKSELIKARSPFYFVKSSVYVNDKLCVRGDFSFAVIKGE